MADKRNTLPPSPQQDKPADTTGMAGNDKSDETKGKGDANLTPRLGGKFRVRVGEEFELEVSLDSVGKKAIRYVAAISAILAVLGFGAYVIPSLTALLS